MKKIQSYTLHNTAYEEATQFKVTGTWLLYNKFIKFDGSNSVQIKVLRVYEDRCCIQTPKMGVYPCYALLRRMEWHR